MYENVVSFFLNLWYIVNDLFYSFVYNISIERGIF